MKGSSDQKITIGIASVETNHPVERPAEEEEEFAFLKGLNTKEALEVLDEIDEMEMQQEKQHDRLIKMICAFLVFFLLAFILFMYGIQRQRARQPNTAVQDNARLTELYYEYKAIEDEIEELDALGVTKHEMGSFVFLCTSAKEWVKEMETILEQYGYIGTIGISLDSFPGERGNMTVNEVSGLADRGWKLCYVADTEEEIVELNKRCYFVGLPYPTSLYTKEKWEDTSCFETFGIETVFSYLSDDIGGVWNIPLLASQASDCSAKIQTAAEESSYLAVVFGDLSIRDYYDKQTAKEICETVETCCNQHGMKVVTPEETQVRYHDYIKATEKAENDFRKKREELVARHEEINKEIVRYTSVKLGAEED